MLEFREVFESFKRVANVTKGNTNSLKPPETFYMSKTTTHKDNKYKKMQNYEHYLNLLS